MPREAAGFTYIGLLIAVVILGLGLSAIGTVWRTEAQREREQELLFVGRQYREAIASYYAQGGQYPRELDDLLEDKRWPEPRHHLRRLYSDPMTGVADWHILRSTDAGVAGISSSSAQPPIKKAGFLPEEAGFADAKCYCDWQFLFNPGPVRRRGAAVPPSAD